MLPPIISYKLALSSTLAWQRQHITQSYLLIWQKSVQFYACCATAELNNIWFWMAMARHINKRLFGNPLTNYRPVIWSVII